jgi:acyl-CoA synthetase (AMP-forming)/AMP-acid ligase II
MRTDVSGWTTRLNDEVISAYTRSGAWRNRTIADSARHLAETSPARVIVIEDGSRLSCQELWDAARTLAGTFVGLGLEPGDVISFQLPNWPEAMVINLAASLLGLVVNPIVPIYRAAEVGFILKDTRSQLLFIPGTFRNFDYRAMVEGLRHGLPELRDVVIVRADIPGYRSYADLVAAGRTASVPLRATDPNAVKFVMYTSGTTGQPKGVLHSHNTIMAELDAVIDYWRLTSSDVVLMPSPVTHVTGYLYGLELPLVAGLKAVFMERWEVGRAIDLIENEGVTFSVGATPFLHELTAEARRRATALPSLRLFACGGAPVPPEVIYRAYQVLEQCTACRVYGSTEAPTITLGVSTRAEKDFGASTDGRIVGNEVRIRDAATGETLPAGEEGEITTRGPEVMIGYADPEQTRNSFDSEGYFYTGDLGRTVAGGFLTVSGRKKDLIIRGGENISPKEIEDVLHQHPAIKEVAIVAMPSARMGETVCACAVLNAGHSLDLPEVTRFLTTAGLATQKFPERLELLEELPRTPSGKVLKTTLREMVARTLAAET